MATMGRDVYLLRFMLSRWSNGEKQIFNFSGLSLSRRSNSEELTRFRAVANTVFQNRPLLCNRMQQKNVLFSETYSFDRNLLFDFMCVAWLSARKKSHVKSTWRSSRLNRHVWSRNVSERKLKWRIQKQKPTQLLFLSVVAKTVLLVPTFLTDLLHTSTGETRAIKSNLTCDTKNLIYMIQCNRCNLQYIGETKRRLKDRFNEHRRVYLKKAGLASRNIVHL